MEIRILHLSDLHVTEPHETLEGTWNTAAQHAGTGYDFIVVSGDLTQRATEAEYRALEAFVDRLLLRHLKSPERRRVVVVPGNHDVDWAWCERIATPVPMSEVPGDPEYQRFLKLPERSLLRVYFDPARAALTGVRYDADRYRGRFEQFQAFIQRFYGKEGVRGHHFACTSGEEHHWSAHLFLEEGVAFYGFNSCRGNDRHWTGASLSGQAIDAAGRHLLELRGSLLPIAVWHHGLTSGRGGSDHLVVNEMSRLAELGFRIGLHGHTHEDELRYFNSTVQLIFPVLGIGSLGAGPDQRPGGVGNQFASISLYNRRYLVQRIHRRRESSGWELEDVRSYDLDGAPAVKRAIPLIGRHQRRVRVDPVDGVATTRVALEDVEMDGEIRLAAVRRYPERNLEAAQELTGDAGLRVERRDFDGRMGFFVVGKAQCGRVEWSYRISNSCAIYPFDATFRSTGDLADLGLARDEDGFAHIVAAIARELVLAVEFASDGSDPPTPAPLVEGGARVRVDDPAPRGWEYDARESASLTASLLQGPRSLEVRVPNPIVGNRYALIYRFPVPPAGDAEVAADLLEQLLDRCRGVQRLASRSDLASRLTRDLDVAIRRSLSDRGSRPLHWVAYLWHRAQRRLIPGFGSFPREAWGFAFPYGHGLVGHAFRLGAPVCWNEPSPRPLYFAAPEDVQHPRPHRWIACLPILLRPSGPPVGVLAFADHGLGETRASASSKIEACVRLCQLGSGREAAREQIRTLSAAVTNALWVSLSRDRDTAVRRLAADALASWRSRVSKR